MGILYPCLIVYLSCVPVLDISVRAYQCLVRDIINEARFFLPSKARCHEHGRFWEDHGIVNRTDER